MIYLYCMVGRKQLLHSIHHLITGAVLIIKGVDKISHHPFIGGLILFFGVVILSYFIYALNKKQHSHNLELVVHWFEALVALFMAYIFFSEGKTFLPYVFLLAAIGFFISIYLIYKKAKGLEQK